MHLPYPHDEGRGAEDLGFTPRFAAVCHMVERFSSVCRYWLPPKQRHSSIQYSDGVVEYEMLNQ